MKPLKKITVGAVRRQLRSEGQLMKLSWIGLVHYQREVCGYERDFRLAAGLDVSVKERRTMGEH